MFRDLQSPTIPFATALLLSNSSTLNFDYFVQEEDQLTPDAQLDSLFRLIVRGVERGPSEQRQRQVHPARP